MQQHQQQAHVALDLDKFLNWKSVRLVCDSEKRQYRWCSSEAMPKGKALENDTDTTERLEKKESEKSRSAETNTAIVGSIYCVHTSSSAIVKEVGVEEKEDKISGVVGRAAVFSPGPIGRARDSGPKNGSAAKIMQKKKNRECAFL